jgi:predicted transposase YbfD/YdcC
MICVWRLGCSRGPLSWQFALPRRLPSQRTEKGKTTREVVYGITSLSRERADAQSLLELTRQHWGIENGSHYRLDVTLGEDQSRVRKGSAPQILAGLRNSIVHLVKDVAPGLATAIRRLGNCFSQALDLLGLPQLE